jgi:hypothetical protein
VHPPLIPHNQQNEGADITPIKVDFDFATAVANFVFTKVWDRSWSPAQSKEYLRLCGFSGELQNNIADDAAAQRHLPLEQAKMPPLPSSWSRKIPLHCYIDAIMHMLFLGVVDSTTEIIAQALKSAKIFTTFATRANKLLIELKKLSVDMARCLPFSGERKTMGSWVSEQQVAICRVYPAIFSFLEDLSKTTKDPWLYVHCYRLINSLHVMIAHIMTRSREHDTKRLQILIEIFLSAVADIDDYIREHSDKKKAHPTWFTQSNFLCLLNLPAIILLFGHPRDYWEGSECGGKYLQRVKPLVHGMRAGDGFLVSILQRVVDCAALEKMADHD